MWADDTGAPTLGNVIGIDIYFEDLGANVSNFMGMQITMPGANKASSRHTCLRLTTTGTEIRNALLVDAIAETGIEMNGSTFSVSDITLQAGHIILDESNGIQIDDYQVGDGVLAAQASNRRKLYYVEGAGGVADLLYAIMKGADNNYSAVQVAIG